MTDEVKKRLLDALEACREIAEYAEGLDFPSFVSNQMARKAIYYEVGVIGEALNVASTEDPTLGERVPELRRIIGIRHRVFHGYDSVDDEIVWDVVQNKVPVLEGQLSALLDDLGEDG
jgi:uncharacterized protein with HEPN domain